MADDSPEAAFETCLKDLEYISNAWDNLFDDERNHLVKPFTEAIDAMKAIFEIVPARTLLQYLPNVAALRRDLLKKSRANLLVHQMNGLVSAFLYGVENPLKKPPEVKFNFSFAPEAETDGSHAETRIAKAKAGQTGQQPMTKLDQRELWTVKPTDQPDSIQSRRQRLSGDFKDKNQPLKLPWNDISDSESWTSCSSKESKLSTVEPKKDPSSSLTIPNPRRTAESTRAMKENLLVRSIKSSLQTARFGTRESLVYKGKDTGPWYDHEPVRAQNLDRKASGSPVVQSPASELPNDNGQRFMKELAKPGVVQPIRWFSTTGLPTHPKFTGIDGQKPLLSPTLKARDKDQSESASKSQVDFGNKKRVPPGFSFLRQDPVNFDEQKEKAPTAESTTLFPIQTSGKLFQQKEPPKSPTPKETQTQPSYWSPGRLVDWRNDANTSQLQSVKEREKISQSFSVPSLLPIPTNQRTSYPDVNLRRPRKRPTRITDIPKFESPGLSTPGPKDEDAMPSGLQEPLKPSNVDEAKSRLDFMFMGRMVEWGDGSNQTQVDIPKAGSCREADRVPASRLRDKTSAMGKVPSKSELIAALEANAKPRLTMTGHRVGWDEKFSNALLDSAKTVPSTTFNFSVDPPVVTRGLGSLPVYKEEQWTRAREVDWLDGGTDGFSD